MLIDLAANDAPRPRRNQMVFADLGKLLTYKLQMRQRSREPLALWCCGIGDGSSVLALVAMCEGLRAKGLPFTYQLFASDAAAPMVQKLHAGIFLHGDPALAGLTNQDRERLFGGVHGKQNLSVAGSYELLPAIRQRLRLAQDTTRPCSYSGQLFDVIYASESFKELSGDEKSQALVTFGGSLRPDGYAVLGAPDDDELALIDTEFYPVAFERCTFYQFDRSLALAELMHRGSAS